MERRPTRIRTTLAVSVLALTLIVPWALGQDPDLITATRLAAEQGDAGSQLGLGLMYRDGRGVPQDDAEAVRWFRLAAEQGLTGAQSLLGFMYANGAGVMQDDAEAMKWYRMAAEQGYADAQFNLGNMYADGRGVLKDDAEAVRLFLLASEARCRRCADQPRASCTPLAVGSRRTMPRPCAGAGWRRARERRGTVQPWGHVQQWPWRAAGRRRGRALVPSGR